MFIIQAMAVDHHQQIKTQVKSNMHVVFIATHLLLIVASSPHYLIVHLLRAIEDVNHHPQSAAQVLGCLSLASASRTRGGTTHHQVKRLCPYT